MQKRELAMEKCIFPGDPRKANSKHSPTNPFDLTRIKALEKDIYRIKQDVQLKGTQEDKEETKRILDEGTQLRKAETSRNIKQQGRSIDEGTQLRKAETSRNIKRLIQTLQTWNRHTKSNENCLYYNKISNILKIYNGLKTYSFPLPLEHVEHFNSMLQKWNKHANEHERILQELRRKLGDTNMAIHTYQDDRQTLQEQFVQSLQQPDKADSYTNELARINRAFQAAYLDKNNIAHKDTSPSRGSDGNDHSQGSHNQTNNDIVEPVNYPREIPASSIKKLLYDHFGGITDESKKRDTFDKIYKEACNKLEKSINHIDDLQGIDSTNNADSDLYPKFDKLRSSEIISGLKDAIQKFNTDIKLLKEFPDTYKKRIPKLLEDEEPTIRKLIENSQEHRIEIQRRQEFDQKYNDRFKAKEQEIIKKLEPIKRKEMQRRQEFDQKYKSLTNRQQLDSDETHDFLLKEYQKRFQYDKNEKGYINSQTMEDNQIKNKELERRNIFNKEEEDNIKQKLHETMCKKLDSFTKWYRNECKKIVSIFQEEIEQFKKAEDYRRFRKDSKFGAH
jgi:hypothetical protein